MPFNTNSVYYFGLKVRLILARFGWGTVVACLLCTIGGAGLIWFVPLLRAQEEVHQRALSSAQKSLAAAAKTVQTARLSIPEERMAKFYDALGEKNYAEQQIKALFAIAGKNDLLLSQAEYKSAYEINSNTHTYKIQLPVRGPYPAIRQFCEQTLRAIPFASLDELSFKRDAIGNATVDAKLRFTLYLDAAPAVKQGEGLQ